MLTLRLMSTIIIYNYIQRYTLTTKQIKMTSNWDSVVN